MIIDALKIDILTITATTTDEKHNQDYGTYLNDAA